MQAFASGFLKCILVLGPPGTGKRTTVRTAVGPDACWISGNASPFGIYSLAYAHRDAPIVLDDVDDLHRSKDGVRLLKSLCQSDPVRTVQWTTMAPQLKKADIPSQFQTRSPVALIANDWSTVGPNVAAIEDRVHIVLFEPTAAEVHAAAARWFQDREIYDFIGHQLQFLELLSFRLYVRAAERKAAGLDWKSVVLGSCFQGTTLTVARLRADPAFAREEDRVTAFIESGAGSRATYFSHARKLRSTLESNATTVRRSVVIERPSLGISVQTFGQTKCLSPSGTAFDRNGSENSQVELAEIHHSIPQSDSC